MDSLMKWLDGKIQGCVNMDMPNEEWAFKQVFEYLVRNKNKYSSPEREIIIEKIIEKEVVKEVPVEIIVEKEIEKVVEKIIEVPKVVEIVKEVPVEKIIERIVEVEKQVPVDKIVEVEKQVAVEKVIEIPVEKVVEKIIEVPKIVEIVKEVPIDRIIEKEVEKIVEKEIIKEVPVEVEKEIYIIDDDVLDYIKAYALISDSVELSFLDSITDEDFVKLVEENGRFYSMRHYQTALNKRIIDTSEYYIRFIIDKNN